MSKRFSRWLKNLAALAGSTLVCFAAAEFALRLISPVQPFVNPAGSFHRADPEPGWLGRSNLNARFRKVDFDVMVQSDTNGFRARKSALQPAAGSPVIAILGDSFTRGWGVENGSVFTDIMQNELGAQADVRNFGMNAYGTLQELLLLKRLLSEDLRPKHVFVMFYSNDFYNNLDTDPWQPSLAVAGTNVTFQNYPVARRYVRPFIQLVKKSYLLSSIGYVFDFTKAQRHITRLEETTFPNGAVAEAPRRAMAYCLIELRAVCQEAGSQLCAVHVPAFNDVQPEATTDSGTK